MYDIVKLNRTLFEEISRTVFWEKVGSSYQKFLASINDKVRNSLLRGASMDTIKTLNVRLGGEGKESSVINTGMSKDINDSLVHIMDMIKNTDEPQRLALRESIFPLQSTTMDYAETQRKENRSLDIHDKTKFSDQLIKMCQSRFEKIQYGLPKIMSAFLKELFNLRSFNQKFMFVSNVQYRMDEWCCKHLFDTRMQYLESVKELTSLKENEIKHKKMKQVSEAMKNKLRNSIKNETLRCIRLSKRLLDMSVGIESIFREIGEIYETTKRNDTSLIEELAKCIREITRIRCSTLDEGSFYRIA